MFRTVLFALYLSYLLATGVLKTGGGYGLQSAPTPSQGGAIPATTSPGSTPTSDQGSGWDPWG